MGLGTGDWSGAVAAGTYEVAFRTRDGHQMLQTVTVEPGQSVALCWDFTLDSECGAPRPDGTRSGRPDPNG